MPWYRIVPKSGNRRYLEIPRGSIDDGVLKNVKSISCWSTEHKPKNVNQLVFEECNPVIYINKSNDYQYRAYIMIQAIAQHLKLNAILDVRVVECSSGLYIRFTPCGERFYDKKTIVKSIFDKLLHHEYFHGKFMEEISSEVFLAFRKKDFCKIKYNLNVDSFAKEYGQSSEDIRSEISNLCSRFPADSMHIEILTIKAVFEELLKKTGADDEIQFYTIQNKLNNCLFFKRSYSKPRDEIYYDTAFRNFFISLGSLGKKYLIKSFFEEKVKQKLDAIKDKTPSQDPSTFGYLHSQLLYIYLVYHEKKIAPMRCSKRYPSCGIWCGAHSPTELIDNIKSKSPPFPLEPIDYWKQPIHDASLRFLEQLPRARVIFRKSELHSWFPKSIRSPHDINLAISYLISSQLITERVPTKGIKPGKKSSLFFICWDNFYESLWFKLHRQNPITIPS